MPVNIYSNDADEPPRKKRKLNNDTTNKTFVKITGYFGQSLSSEYIPNNSETIHSSGFFGQSLVKQ